MGVVLGHAEESSGGLLIATGNRGKLREFSQLLEGRLGRIGRLRSLDEFAGYQSPIEDGEDFRANAYIKARSAADYSGMAVLADDSGLCCLALDGAPGLYSARFGGDCSDIEKNQKLWDLLRDKEDKRAYFACAVAYVKGDAVHFGMGELRGQIVAPREGEGEGKLSREGSGGFGYDPIFMADGYEQSLAEIPLHEKNRISHRALAVQDLLQGLGLANIKAKP